jgi:hypothetical protein
MGASGQQQHSQREVQEQFSALHGAQHSVRKCSRVQVVG